MSTPRENRIQARGDLAWSIAVGGMGIVAFAAALALAWYSAGTLFLLFAGILFGVFLSAMTDLLGRVVGLGHSFRLVIVCVLFVVMLGGVGVLGGATIAQQATALSSTIRSQVGNVKEFLEKRGVDTSFVNLGATPVAPAASSTDAAAGATLPAPSPASPAASKGPRLPDAGTIASGTGAIFSQTVRVIVGLFEGIGNFFVVIFLGLLLAAQPQLYNKGLQSFIPKRYAASGARLLNDIGETLRRWLLGQLLTMTSLFVITWVGLMVIGIPGALVLGFITGLLSFIPNIGAILAGTLIVLASLGSGTTAIASSFGLYLAVQFLEGNVLTPLIQRHAIEIPPATLFAAQIFLGVLFGLWGLALALPLIAVAKVTINHLWPGEDNDRPPEFVVA